MTPLDEDPNDWPKSFKELQNIDNLLRCSICFEYFDTAVVVPNCSHNYCSLCVRKHVAQKKCCPTCSKPLHDIDLKPNRVLDLLVHNFKSVRLKLLKAVTGEITLDGASTGNNPSQPDVEQVDSQESVFEVSQKFRAPKNKKKLGTQKPQESSLNTSKQHKEKFSETVLCPICSASMPPQNINSHSDMCLSKQEQTATASFKRKNPPSTLNLNHKKPKWNEVEVNSNESSATYIETTEKHAANDFIDQSTSNTMKPLPKFCFDAMTDKQLRAKAKSFGLQRNGDKMALIRRLKEYVLVYNSQCDSTTPLSPNSVVKKVEENERVLASYKPTHVVHTHDHHHTDKDKEDFAKAHAVKYSRQYDDLINEVKSRQGYKKKPIKIECSDSDENEAIFHGDAEEYVFEIKEINESKNNESTWKEAPTKVMTSEAGLSASQKSDSNASTHKGGTRKKARTSKNSKDTRKIKTKDISSFFSKKKGNVSSRDGLIEEDESSSGKRIEESPSLIAGKDCFSGGEQTFSPEVMLSPRWRGNQSVLNSTAITNEGVSTTPSRMDRIRVKEKSRRRLSLQKEKLKSIPHCVGEGKSIPIDDLSRASSVEENDATTREIDHSPSLFDDVTENEFTFCEGSRLSSVSEEINFLVDRLDHHNSSGSSTDVEELVPRPPSNLDFTEIDSQRFDFL